MHDYIHTGWFSNLASHSPFSFPFFVLLLPLPYAFFWTYAWAIVHDQYHTHKWSRRKKTPWKIISWKKNSISFHLGYVAQSFEYYIQLYLIWLSMWCLIHIDMHLKCSTSIDHFHLLCIQFSYTPFYFYECKCVRVHKREHISVWLLLLCKTDIIICDLFRSTNYNWTLYGILQREKITSGRMKER